uniref:EF-hand domain-containing protein n=1 Tax=Ditylenchus dipsaci TaxID=166011 RepID=A0A915DNG4_9BILA
MRDLARGSGAEENGGWVIQLPEHFVDSLRVLFDILDTSRCGLVSFEQIAKKWGDFPSPTNHLPSISLNLSGESPQEIGEWQLFRKHIRKEVRLYIERQCLTTMGLNGYGRTNHLNGALSHRSQPAINGDYLHDNKNHSFESAKRAINENLSLNGRVSSRKAQAANYSIIMRPKKMKNVRAPLPPQHDSPRPEAAVVPLPNKSFRPLSTNSMGSVCSSGMTEVRWRNSRICNNSVNAQGLNNTENINNNSSPSPPSNSTVTSYAEELQPQVVGLMFLRIRRQNNKCEKRGTCLY